MLCLPSAPHGACRLSLLGLEYASELATRVQLALLVLTSWGSTSCWFGASNKWPLPNPWLPARLEVGPLTAAHDHPACEPGRESLALTGLQYEYPSFARTLRDQVPWLRPGSIVRNRKHILRLGVKEEPCRQVGVIPLSLSAGTCRQRRHTGAAHL